MAVYNTQPSYAEEATKQTIANYKEGDYIFKKVANFDDAVKSNVDAILLYNVDKGMVYDGNSALLMSKDFTKNGDVITMSTKAKMSLYRIQDPSYYFDYNPACIIVAEGGAKFVLGGNIFYRKLELNTEGGTYWNYKDGTICIGNNLASLDVSDDGKIDASINPDNPHFEVYIWEDPLKGEDTFHYDNVSWAASDITSVTFEYNGKKETRPTEYLNEEFLFPCNWFDHLDEIKMTLNCDSPLTIITIDKSPKEHDRWVMFRDFIARDVYFTATSAKDPTKSISAFVMVGVRKHDLQVDPRLTIPATCGGSGWELAICTGGCGLKEKREIPAIPHDYVNGVCTMCGKAASVQGIGGSTQDKDGSANKEQTVADKNIPATGDSSNLAMWILLLVACSGGTVALARKNKKTN